MEAEKAKIERNLQEREQEIADVKKNIEILEHSKGLLVGKQSFLESNMKNKQAVAKGGSSKPVQAD